MKQLILLFLVLASFQISARTNDLKLVKDTFNNYKKAILASDGKEAAKWVDKKTFAYYGKMLAMTLKADSAEVAVLPLMDRLTVLSLRHRVPMKDIAALDGKQLFIYSIDQGMVGRNSVANVEIGEVVLNGNSASGQLVASGEESPLYFKFNKEDGQWKLDLTSLFGPTTEGLQKMLVDQGMTENQFIFQALEMMTGKPVSDKIWSPE